ncbi:MAG: signal peptidase II [Patescibacteria group bacterium]
MNKLFLNLKNKNIAIASVIAIFFMIDRYLKLAALHLANGEPIKLIGNIFSFNFTANYYLAFSLPLSGPLVNSLIILIIIGLIYYILLNRRDSAKRWEVIILTFIIFGAISNILDRLIYGYVIDYLELKYFTVFNLADVMISGGAIILLTKTIKLNKKTAA